MTRFEAPRGTHDILPSEQPLWRHVTRTMEEVCRLYCYRPITTPVFGEFVTVTFVSPKRGPPGTVTQSV